MFIIPIILLGIFTSFNFGATNAFFTSNLTIEDNTISTGNIFTPVVDFFLYDGEQAVGFTLEDLKGVVKIDYEITYERDGGIGEGITGSEDKDPNEENFTSEKIVLGTCSGVDCVYHEGVGEVFLKVILTYENGDKKTLTDSLLIENGEEEIPLPEACSALSGTITNKIEGTNGKDTLRGTSGNDLILGLGDNDTIDGNGGSDCILGGEGDDKIEAGTGNDIILGGEGKDTIKGETGNDTIYGGTGNDILSGGTGDDKVYGEEGSDTLTGESNNDFLNGGPDNDSAHGGSGSDTCLAESLTQCEL